MTVAVAKRPIHVSRLMTARWRKGRFILPMKTRSSTVSVKSVTRNRGVGVGEASLHPATLKTHEVSLNLAYRQKSLPYLLQL